VSEPTLAFHGAAGTVTGSCYELRSGDASLLVDCGLFQGPRSLQALNFSGFAFAPGKLDALVLTHAHLDHSGLLPRLVAQGFGGPIWCTPATAQLLPHLLRDSARLMEQDADRRNRRRDRVGEREIEPLYLLEDVERMLRQVLTVRLSEQFTPCGGVQARLWNAGHVLGSASVELEASGVRLLFSGDLSTLLFVGYQAAGTLGRTILEGAKRVRVSGEDVNVRLHVREIGSYSAHADRRELLAWVEARKPVGGTIFVTHGEAAALKSLQEELGKSGLSVRVPELGEVYALAPAAAAHRMKTGRPDLRDVLSRDWQNDYADLAVNLKKELARIDDQKRRREAIARMRAVLDSYRESRADRRG
jgi:Cft2 family RNA processing exonuclease